MGLGCNRERNRDLCRRYAADDLVGWYVVMPAPARTANAVRELRRGGLAVFEPMLTERRRPGGAARLHGRRAGCLYRSAMKRMRVDVDVPMFPGYVFVRAPGVDDLALIYRTAWVDGILCGASDRAAEVPPAAMAWIRHVHRSRAADAAPLFQPGDAVKVIDGPMMSFTGTVDRVQKTQKIAGGHVYEEDRVNVLIDILGAIRPVSFSSESLAQQ